MLNSSSNQKVNSDGTTVYVKEDEPSFKEQVKQKLLKDTIYNNGDIRYYLVKWYS